MIKELISRIKGQKEQPKQVQEQPKAFEAYKELRDMQNAASSFDFKQMENNPLKMSVEEQDSILSNNYPKPTLKDNTGKKYAMDGGMGGHYNPNSMITTSGRADDRIFEFYGNHGFIGWQLCAIIYQNWLVANACNVPVEDALRPLWKTTLTKGKEEAPELAKDLNDKVFKQYKLADKLRKHGINMKQFGVSYAMLCLEENHDYTKPFNIDGIMPGQFKGVAIIDPYWVMPNWSAHNLNNPTDPDFYEPEFYTIQGQTRVHKSYIVKVINQEVADIIKPSYYFGGVPLTQQIYERIYAAERTANEAPLLALTKRLLVVPTNLRAIIENPRIAWDMVKMLVTNRDNQGVYFTEDGEGNNVHQVDTSLSDMDAVIMSQYQLVASIARIPAHKLLKTDPRGMNNSGDYSIKDYIQELQSLQEKAFRTLIERVNEIVLRAELGEKEAVQNVEFEPIDMPSEMDKAQVEQISAQTASAYVTAGILTPEEVRDVLRNEKGGKWAGIAEELPSEEFPEDLLDPTDNNPEGGVPGLEDMATDEWEESKHKRDDNGKFTSEGVGGATNSEKETPAQKTTNEENSENGEFEVPTDVFLRRLAKAKIEKVAPVNNSEKALNELSKTFGKPIKNKEQNIEAYINRVQANKMVSNKAVEKSINNGFTREEHYAVASIAPALFANSIIRKRRNDISKDLNVPFISRFVAPVSLPGKKAYAKFLLKEIKEAGKRVYSVELHSLEQIENGAGLDRWDL